MRVVVDTNVLISAFLWQGPAKEIFVLTERGAITLCATNIIVDELERVLSYPKFKAILTEQHFTPYTLVTAYLKIVTLYPSINLSRPYIVDDPSDDAFLACALVARVAAIISGDHHLTALKYFNGIPIVTPTQFLRGLRNSTPHRG